MAISAISASSCYCLASLALLCFVSTCKTSMENTSPPLPLAVTAKGGSIEQKANINLRGPSVSSVNNERSEIERGTGYFVNWTAMNELCEMMERSGDELLIDDDDD
mmetsp:Transcript_33341/g.74742  ORF Transcript_33341/g.74742 Transcript_33341/m.74742 type:complete len:106 (-) Transcript_33341:187-504(-)|eukprot:144101-Hanusia_phi.AAC.7